MKICIVNGSPRKGNTYRAAQIFKDELSKIEDVEYSEIFLPKDMPNFCRGCCACIEKGEKLCPDYEAVNSALKMMTEADGLIFTTPVFVMDMSGGMKAFLDHFGYIYMPHRPRKELIGKNAMVIVTAAGMGINSTFKNIRISLKYWGIKNVLKCGLPIFAYSWDEMPEKKKIRFEKLLRRQARVFIHKIKNNRGIGIMNKIKMNFFGMLLKSRDGSIDKKHWVENGWIK